MNLPVSLDGYSDSCLRVASDAPSYADQMKAAYGQWVADFERTKQPVEIDFRALMSWFKAGDQLTHHIHPYPAKLLPHIAHFFISVFSDDLQDSGIVLDPFCGSGTVALEASLQGFRPYVVDANPLALLIAKAKTTAYSVQHLRTCLEHIKENYNNCDVGDLADVINVDHWYLPQHKANLERLFSVMSQLDDEASDFFKTCFSVLVRKMSLADPSISVPVKLKPKGQFSDEQNQKIIKKLESIRDACVWAEFEKVVEQNLKRVDETNQRLPFRSPAMEVGRDARHIQIDNETVSLVVTSPPYGSAQKYVRASSLSLNWLKLIGSKQLRDCEGASIGREHLSRSRHDDQAALIQRLPDKYESLLEEIATVNPRRAEITRCYLVDMQAAALEMVRVMKSGKRLVIVIGNNQVAGFPVRNDHFLCDIFKGFGLKLEVALIDHIKSRGLMTKRNKTASVISREEVLVFWKHGND